MFDQHLRMGATGRLLVAGLLLTLGVSAQAETGFVVNRVELTSEELMRLEQRLGSALLPGRYWYDARSGLWGREGMANAGQLPANLPIPTPLPADISTGGTGVFVNGREIHPLEYQYLQFVYGQVLPGRYWLNADGSAGFEGGPPAYKLFATAAQRGSAVSGHSMRGGSVIGGGGTTGFIGTDGTSVICGGGGGCTFN